MMTASVSEVVSRRGIYAIQQPLAVNEVRGDGRIPVQ
jgi:hypothetical protein